MATPALKNKAPAPDRAEIQSGKNTGATLEYN